MSHELQNSSSTSSTFLKLPNELTFEEIFEHTQVKTKVRNDLSLQQQPSQYEKTQIIAQPSQFRPK